MDAMGSSTPNGRQADAERRVVSVLFVDLVGFTTFSEGRDPEAVRELLSDYFEQARRIVALYGGTIEKFIGDAVMAVWGTPVARENDAERAVRAGLELVDAVAALGEGTSSANLQARGGVVSGEAAVRLDAVGQGMVAGDVVNTAARVQGQAEPGSLYVDESTREASAQSIGYRAAGEHALKGKAGSTQLFRAELVVAGTSGAMRFDGLEAPLVGRERDLRLVKELFHDSAEQSRARLVVVSGVAGVGKSRLGWEFFKYLDGLALETFWHIGRCLSYGEGVAYWALADMVRMRLRISEGDPDGVVAQRLDDGLAEYVDDAEEREWLRPRLATLLGIGTDQAEGVEQESLFAGWRLFIERLARREPVVLLFEDVQYADAGMLDFVEHLLERSADLPIFMLAMTRPELWDQRPEWAGRARGVTSLSLDRLADEAIGRMLDSLVTGLSETTKAALAARAEGIPLFAIETVRMLIDRDLVLPSGGVYVLAEDVGDLADLDVPPTLQALVAARLDNLPEAERRLVKDASVLGLSFTREALVGLEAAVGSVPVDELDRLLGDLIQREVLTVHTDPRSPEAGQYRFVQKVMRTVAYETLSRRDRKARHLAAANHWQATPDADDLAGVIAAHYLEAADAVPDDPDADELRATSVLHLERAGDRARSLAAADESARYYERALDLATNDDDRARLAERAGAAAVQMGDDDRSLSLLSIAHGIHEGAGRLADLARIAALEGDALGSQARVAEAVGLLTAAFELTKDGPIDPAQASLANSLSSAYFGQGDTDKALEWIERGAVLAESTGAREPLLRAMNVKGMLLVGAGRPVEGTALLRAALDLAVQHRLDHRAALQAGNLALITMPRDLAAADELAQESFAHAARTGTSVDRAFALQAQALVRLHQGRWSAIDLDALRLEVEESGSAFTRVACALPLVAISCWRGRQHEVSSLADGLDADYDETQTRTAMALMRALLDTSGSDRALSEARTAFQLGFGQGLETDEFTISFPVLVQMATAEGHLDVARECIETVRRRPSGLVPPLLRAQLAWLEARVDAADPVDDGDGGGYGPAIAELRDFGAQFWLAWALLDKAEWDAGRGDSEGAAQAAHEALPIFTELEATPFVQRAAALAGVEVAQPIQVALVE